MNKILRFIVIAFAALTTLSFAEPEPKGKKDAANDGYRLVFSDEFNLPNGSQPDESKWSRSKRYSSTWNRWISASKDVVFVRNGKLICRAIANKKEKGDTARMLTGAIETQRKFAFKYGKLECRMKTKCHTGNFPALWLMPEPPAPDHPKGGEIDIFETIDNEKKAYQTVHSNWTINMKKKKDPVSAYSVNVDVRKWHVYGFEWTANMLTWTIDGKVVAVYYKKEKDVNALNNGQWPFDAPFYIIINQSVGSGRWAQNPDVNFVYETQVDWIRVYQR